MVLLLPHLPDALNTLLHVHILDMGQDAPPVARGIEHVAAPVAIELGLRLGNARGPCPDSPLIRAIHVLYE